MNYPKSRRFPRYASSHVRLLCVDQAGSIGGAQKSLLELLPAFARNGWQPSVAAPGDSPFAESIRKAGYETHDLNCGSYTSTTKSALEHFKYASNLPRILRTLEQLVLENQINLLYVNGGRLFPPCAWVARRLGIPAVFHIHNRLVQPSAIALAGRTVRWAGGQLIACCHHAVAPLRRHIDPRRVNVVYNGVQGLNASDRPRTGNLRRIAVVGRVEPEKGQLEFVRAARLISERHPECRFSVVGRPVFSGAEYLQKVVEAAEGLLIDFADWQDDIARLYGSLDLLVVPSSHLEATTRVILEAYSAGVPIVAFPSGGIPEVVRNNETGFLTEEVTAESLANRITSVLEMDKARLMEVIRKARQAWAQHYTLEAYQEAVCDVLSGTALERSARAA